MPQSQRQGRSEVLCVRDCAYARERQRNTEREEKGGLYSARRTAASALNDAASKGEAVKWGGCNAHVLDLNPHERAGFD